MRKIDKSVFTHVNYAHRGLHDIKNGIPENSLAAFRLSAEAGYGTEFDIQLSRDGQVVVFHDDGLRRVCGVDARVDSLDYDELKKLRLLGTDEYIPLFTEVLDVFRGTTAPLIVELKTGRRNDELCDKAIKILSGFDGNFCIESFNPFIVNRFRKKAPHICRGQLASEVSDYIPEQKKIVASLLSSCRFSCMNKPDFIAYKNVPLPKHVKKLMKKGTMLFTWTSRTPDVDQKYSDGVIFENYRPNPKY